MTSPTLIYRELTVNFARSVTKALSPELAPTPLTLQVVLTALSTPTSVVAGSTFVEAPVAREVVLADVTNPVTFRLVPSDLAGLTERVLYRIAWRSGGVTGRTFTYDFAMPDADLTFEQLNSLNYIIDGSVYLQQEDLGRAGGVARLNDAGQVVDAAGTPLAGVSDITSLEAAISAEQVARQNADTQNLSEFQSLLSTQINQAITTTNSLVGAARTELSNQITNEILARQATDAALDLKADLVSGKIPLAQIPNEARTQGVQVANQAAMLALNSTQVQQFDFAIRPDGVFALLGTDPSQLSHWSKLNKVSSVNGLDGDAVITLSGVAAQGGSIAQNQVTGLADALDGKASTASLTAATSRITAIEDDTTIVKTVDGVISHTLNNTRMAYLDVTGQFITRKDGTIISGAGGAVGSVNGEVGNVVLDLTDIAAAGGAVPEAQVTGLSASLLGKVDTSDPRLTDTRTPSTHASTHVAAGSDPLTLATSQVTGLATTLTNQGDRISSLETRVTNVEGGGGEGGTSNVGTLSWFSAPSPTGDFSTLTLHSPFGYDPLNSSANPAGYYYNPAGASSVDVRFPYITPNGHLELRKWDESAPADPQVAYATDVSALTTIVNGKAEQSALDSLTTTVNGKAAQSALDSLTSTVNSKAEQSAVDSLSSSKADQSEVDALTTTVAGKVSQVAIDNLTTIVNGKASQTDLTALTSTVNGKASQASVDSLTTTVDGKASQASVDAKETAANKNQPNGYAGLDGSGKLSTSQMPPLSLSSVQTVANRAAMLALTTTQVQPGDVCIITATSDQGSYILTDTDPTLFANWKILVSPLDSVLSVNGQTGTVTLNASLVGALPADGSAAINSINGLSAALSSKLDASTLTSSLANRPSWSATAGSPTLETVLSSSTLGKQRATYAATSSVNSLNGQQSVDGVIMPLGSIVLLTAQTSSVLNGLWQVNSSAWTRVTDMASGSYLVRGTLVVVSSGTANANTLWQVTSASGVVDTAANNWLKVGNVGNTYTPTAGNGITITGTTPTQTFTVKPSPTVNVGTGSGSDPVRAQSQGITVSSTGVSVDTSIVARKYVADVPAGSTTPRIYHNLNTRRVLVQVIEVSTGIGVLVGWQASAVNYVDLEFSAAPNSGQWAVIVIG